jgi:hypothetical protein
MNLAYARLKIFFLVLFAVLTAAAMIWQVGWIWPEEHCEKAHKWWDTSQRTCAQPILVSDITGRLITDENAKAEALKAIGRER